MLQLTINGESRDFTRALCVADLLVEMSLQGRRVAVERNGEIVPRSRHGERCLAEGDRIEIVHALGGG